ncbi:hypothetical protein QYF36_011498 [Acer negundo]|nr:hypothetical protein QYF36_011498 [Acer negundo]
MADGASLRHKLSKRLKLPIGKSKKSKERNNKSRSGEDDYKSYKKENGGKRNMNSSKTDKDFGKGREGSGGEGFGNDRHKAMNSDRKRKRIYAERDMGGEATINDGAEARSKKNLFKKGHNRVKHDSVNEKRIYTEQDMDGEAKVYDGAEARNKKNLFKKGPNRAKRDSVKEKSGDKSRSIWVSSKLKDASESAEVSNSKWRGKVKQSDKVDSGLNGSLKKFTKSKSDSNKNLNTSQYKFPDVSPSKSFKKTVQNKKGSDGSEVVEEKPKKKKRVIRIDPYDTSNKRLDDGLVIDEKAKEKKKDLEKNAEMSKNAQFRSIQPSPSILSFVEDNLLGRRRSIEIRRAGYNIELSAPLDNIPLSTSSERERIEENIFRNKMEFFAAAKISSSFPAPDLPEIAFAGRSNVGKSSLLNALTRQWGVVRTSDKPGLTQTINFFNLGTKLCLVDLPGYGFAYAKEEVKDAWEELVKEYVSTRVGLKRVCLLIDTKWGMKPRDHELINLMERSQTKYQIVLTKTDTVFPMDVARRAMQIEESLKANRSIVEPVMMLGSPKFNSCEDVDFLAWHCRTEIVKAEGVIATIIDQPKWPVLATRKVFLATESVKQDDWTVKYLISKHFLTWIVLAICGVPPIF